MSSKYVMGIDINDDGELLTVQVTDAGITIEIFDTSGVSVRAWKATFAELRGSAPVLTSASD